MYYTFTAMKLMTVTEYAAHIGKSIPLIYKQVNETKRGTAKKKLDFIVKFGRILIRVK